MQLQTAKLQLFKPMKEHNGEVYFSSNNLALDTFSSKTPLALQKLAWLWLIKKGWQKNIRKIYEAETDPLWLAKNFEDLNSFKDCYNIFNL